MSYADQYIFDQSYYVFLVVVIFVYAYAISKHTVVKSLQGEQIVLDLIEVTLFN